MCQLYTILTVLHPHTPFCPPSHSACNPPHGVPGVHTHHGVPGVHTHHGAWVTDTHHGVWVTDTHHGVPGYIPTMVYRAIHHPGIYLSIHSRVHPSCTPLLLMYAHPLRSVDENSLGSRRE